MKRSSAAETSSRVELDTPSQHQARSTATADFDTGPRPHAALRLRPAATDDIRLDANRPRRGRRGLELRMLSVRRGRDSEGGWTAPPARCGHGPSARYRTARWRTLARVARLSVFMSVTTW